MRIIISCNPHFKTVCKENHLHRVDPPPPVPPVSCTQFPQGCPWSGSVIRPSVAWLLPLFRCWPLGRAPAWTGRVRRPTKTSRACEQHENTKHKTRSACRHVNTSDAILYFACDTQHFLLTAARCEGAVKDAKLKWL